MSDSVTNMLSEIVPVLSNLLITELSSFDFLTNIRMLRH